MYGPRDEGTRPHDGRLDAGMGRQCQLQTPLQKLTHKCGKDNKNNNIFFKLPPFLNIKPFQAKYERGLYYGAEQKPGGK